MPAVAKSNEETVRISRRSEVDPFIVMDVMEQARAAEEAGRHIVHMEVGQPGTAAPKVARQALADALENNTLGYTVALGLPELRQEIAALYKRWYGLELDPARVVVTAGSSAAFILAFTTLFDAGDRVALGVPGYPSYRQILKALSLTPVEVETALENRFQPTVADLEGVSFQGLIVASPANPSGTMLERDALAALIGLAQDRSAAFVSDEIYHGIQFGDRAVSALEISDEVYVINSFSKYFSMTGWRLGWMIVPEDHIRRVERLAQNMFICAPHAAQVAALAALKNTDEPEQNCAVYRKNRDLMIEGLRRAGLRRVAPPDGAFYIYADVSDFTDDARLFAKELLEQAGVAATPGNDFDAVRGSHWMRFSYARSTEEVREGIKRLSKYLAERSGFPTAETSLSKKTETP